ncbi:MAG: ABC-type transport auxiliary lipoprotein family protein [Pseudomonadota bacterium]
MPVRTVLKAAVPALVALAVAGCVSIGGGKIPDTLVTLTPAASAPAGALLTASADSAIIVFDPETDRRLSVQRIAVQVDDANVAYLEEALWIERPARLMRGLLAETIRARGTRLVFENADSAATGRSRLAGRLLDMGYDARAGAAVVRYDGVLETAGSGISTRRFEARVPTASADPAVIGPALNQAANDVAQQVADWVG